MKKLNQSKEKKFRCVRVSPAQLNELWDLFENNCKRKTVEADGFLIENFDEFKKFKQPISDFAITGYEPYLHLQLTPFYARLSIHEDEVKTLGLFEKLKTILEKSQSMLLRFLTSDYTLWSIIILNAVLNILSFTLSILYKYNFNFHGFPYTWFFYPVLIFLIVFWWFINVKRQSLVFPYSKGTFFSRKKDEITLAIISAVIGSILTFFGQWLSKLIG